MSIAYVNGSYVPMNAASVSINDRGYQFADGVYEVVLIHQGQLLDWEEHWQRLIRSLSALMIPEPMSAASMQVIVRALMRKNRRTSGVLYLQITRGVAPRNHVFPLFLAPSLVMTFSPLPRISEASYCEGITVITRPDIRWARRDVKSIALLANVLARNEAEEMGAAEALFYEEDGRMTEGSASNLFIVTAAREVVTHPEGVDILGGITRLRLLSLLRKAGYSVVERPFSREELLRASEVFITSTTKGAMPVVCVDEVRIADGLVGAVVKDIMCRYEQFLKEVSA